MHYAAAGAVVTTKIIESVCMYVCMSGYAFRHALRYPAESWHGGRGMGPRGLWAYFQSDPTWGQRSFRGQSDLEMLYGYQIW